MLIGNEALLWSALGSLTQISLLNALLGHYKHHRAITSLIN